MTQQEAGKVRLTDKQRRALEYLNTRPWVTPADLGNALSDRKHLTAQGAGRIGGSMAGRLIKLGAAESCARYRGGFPAYRITPAGRAALQHGGGE
jgi:hypothetical protein